MFDNLFAEASNAHLKNNFSVAENLYLKILDKYPNDSKTLFLIGTLYIQKKVYKKAINYLLKAHKFDSSNDHLLMNLGIAYKANHDFIKSELMFKQALNINPKNADTLNNLGNLYFENKKHELAIDYFKKAIANNKKDEAYVINLAESLAIVGDFKSAIEHLLSVKSSSNLFFESQLRLFNIFFKSKNYTNCILIGEKLLSKKLDRNHFTKILNNLIHASLELSNYQKAKYFFSKLSPNDKDYLFNKAQIQAADCEIDNAISSYNLLIKNNIKLTQSFHNLGLIYSRHCDLDSAIQSFNNALTINPNLPETRVALGMCQLSQCDFTSGWSNFLNYTNNPIYNYPFLANKFKWDGIAINKSILIMFDQGIGDQIFYSSILNRISESNTYICLVDPKLKDIFINSFSKKIKFISQHELNSIHFDCYIRSAELASLLIKKKSDLNIQKPFLKEKKVELGKKNIIGISWHSSNKFIGKNKSIDLISLITKLKNKTNIFLNLQYGDFKKEVKEISSAEKVKIIEYDEIDNFNNIKGLARLILACNEIYTVSNTTAHLAAALGAKVNLLLPFDHHANTWYWFSDLNNRSLWYPNVKIFEAKPYNSIKTSLDKII